MGKSKKRSKYTAELETLGFKLVAQAPVITGMNRRERRARAAQPVEPYFTSTGILTLATDEIGQTWHGPPDTSLAHLGFYDRSNDGKALLRALNLPSF